MTTIAIHRTHGHAWSDVHAWAGALTGVMASLIMGAVAMVATLVQGRGLFFVPEKIATLVLSDADAATAFGIVTGLGIHVLLGAIFGVIFAALYILLTGRYEVVSAVGLGVLFGLALWALNFLIIGPAVGAQLTASLGGGEAVLTHVVFGLALGLYPLLIKGHTE